MSDDMQSTLTNKIYVSPLYQNIDNNYIIVIYKR